MTIMSSDPDIFGPPPLPWRKVRVLGRGSYGTVYLAICVGPNPNGLHRRIAVKTARLENATSLFKENKIYEAFQGCPEIVQCYFDQITFEGGLRHYNLLLEYAPAGTLENLIERTGGLGFPEYDVRAYARMILRGLLCMHAKGYVHCDLKPANILAFPNSPGDGNNIKTAYQLKLADFGLVKEPQEETPRDEWIGRFRGTPNYMAPESVGLGLLLPALDIWSLGCTVVQMITGWESPWPSYEHLSIKEFENLLVRSRHMTPMIPLCMSDTGKDFLRRCLQRDPRKRWSAQMLLLHPYVNGLVSETPQTASAQHH